MNRKGLALSAVLLATVGAVSAIAAAGVHHRGGGGGDGGWHQSHMGKGHGFHRGGKRHAKMGPMIRLKQSDADNDGTVTLDEFLKPRAEKFCCSMSAEPRRPIPTIAKFHSRFTARIFLIWAWRSMTS